MNIHPVIAQLLHQAKQSELKTMSKQTKMIRSTHSESPQSRVRRFLSDIRK